MPTDDVRGLIERLREALRIPPVHAKGCDYGVARDHGCACGALAVHRERTLATLAAADAYLAATPAQPSGVLIEPIARWLRDCAEHTGECRAAEWPATERDCLCGLTGVQVMVTHLSPAPPVVGDEHKPRREGGETMQFMVQMTSLNREDKPKNFGPFEKQEGAEACVMALAARGDVLSATIQPATAESN